MSIQHPDDVYHTVHIVTQCLCIPIVSCFVFLRFYTRFRLRTGLGVEDYACALAWALFMAYCAIGIIVGQHGGGYHIGDLTDTEITQFKKFCYISTVLYCPMAFAVKVSILFILTRIFAPYHGRVLFIYILLGCLCIYYLIALIVKIRMCDPIPLYWLGRMPDGGGSCLDQSAALIADSIISVVSDVIILVLPLPLTWSLQMPRNKKLRVMGMLSAGGLATGFSLYRLILVLKEGNSPDQTIILTCVILSGNAEAGVGIICACLPTLNHFIAHLRVHCLTRKMENGNRTIQLRARKTRSDSKPKHPRWPKNEGFQPKLNDQSHLIAFASTPDATDSVYIEDGIRKTVAFTQTVDKAGDSSPSLNAWD